MPEADSGLPSATPAKSGIKFDTNLRDRILIFEDTNQDGRFDKRTVFWDQAQRLTSIAVGHGGVWATCAPTSSSYPIKTAMMFQMETQ